MKIIKFIKPALSVSLISTGLLFSGICSAYGHFTFNFCIQNGTYMEWSSQFALSNAKITAQPQSSGAPQVSVSNKQNCANGAVKLDLVDSYSTTYTVGFYVGKQIPEKLTFVGPKNTSNINCSTTFDTTFTVESVSGNHITFKPVGYSTIKLYITGTNLREQCQILTY